MKIYVLDTFALLAYARKEVSGDIVRDLLVQGKDEKIGIAMSAVKHVHLLPHNSDCFAAALAQELNATIVTGDPEFQTLSSIINIQFLPK